MEIKKEKWESLRLENQQFTPLEYVAQCYRFCCDCEASFDEGRDLYYGLYQQIPNSHYPASPSWPNGINSVGKACYKEASGLIHHGEYCECGGSNVPCHTDNDGLNVSNVQNWHEIWNTYINGTITSNYGANAPTFRNISNNAFGYLQELVYFTDGAGRTHYGRAEAIPGYTWNHS